MSYLIVEDFKYGLDSRRSFLNAVPGSLTKLENGHITQGGEAEKRKAFVGISGLKSTSQLPSGCFGLQSTTAGLFTFGSISTPAGIPSGISYQRLQHPDGSTAMSSIVHSTAFAGLAWVIAKFSDGNVYPYYNGALITDFTDGLVLASQNTNVKIATALTSAINRNGTYTAVQQANPNDNKLDIFGQPGSLYASASVVNTTNSGALTVTELNEGTASIIGTQATAQFKLSQGIVGTQATQILLNDGTVVTDGDTVTIGTRVYRFKATMSQAYDVQRDPSAGTTSMTNLQLAINANGIAGTNYFTGTLANTQVTATNPTQSEVLIVSISGGTTGNSIATTETSAHLAWGGTTMTGGTNNSITAVTVNSTIQLMINPVNWSISAVQTAINLTTEINNNSATSGYSAKAGNDGTVFLTAIAFASTANNFPVSVTVNGGICIGNSVFTLTQTQTGSTFNVTNLSIDGVIITTGAPAITWQGSLSATCVALAANINANTATSGYVCCAISNIIYLSKKVTASSDPSQLVVCTVTTGGGVGTLGQAGLSATLTVASIGFAGSQSKQTDSTKAAGVNVSNGSPPYLYQWTAMDFVGGVQHSSLTGITANSPTSPTTTFHCSNRIATSGSFIVQGQSFKSLTRSFICTVTDSLGSVSVSATLSVTCSA